MSRLADALNVLAGRAAVNQETPKPQTGEIAFADPTRLFPGSEAFPTYNPDALVTTKGLRIFEEMRRDEQVKIALAFKKMAVLSSGWEITIPDGRPEDWEPAEFLRDDLAGIKGTVSQSLMGIMTALDFGYSISEKIFEERDRQIHLKELRTKRPESFMFRQDEFGQIPDDGLVQIGTPKGNVDLPTDKFIIYTYGSDFCSNPYGVSDLTACYRAWWTKHNTYKWLAMLLERFGIPPLFALYDPNQFNPSQQNDLKDVIKNLQARSSGIIPRGEKDSFELWAPELAGQVSRVFIPALDKMDKDLARALLMPGNMGMTPDEAAGSFARSKVIFDVFMFAIDFLRDQIEDVLHEQLFRPLVMFNYPLEPDEVPRFRFKPITDERRTDLLETWTKIVAVGGVKQTPEDEAHIREVLEFPEREFDDDEEMPQLRAEPDSGDPDDDAEEDERETENAHEHGVVMLAVNGRDAAAVMGLHEQLAERSGFRPETDIHSTVRFGINGDPEAVARTFRGQPPVMAEVMGKRMFPGDTTHNGEDAIVLLLDGIGFRRLREAIKLGEGFEMIDERFPEHVPHITLGYLPAGQGEAALADLDLGDVQGRIMELDTLVYSDREGSRRTIPLTGMPGQGLPMVPMTHDHAQRDMTAAEKRANLQEQGERLDERDSGLIDVLAKRFRAARDDLRKKLGSKAALTQADASRGLGLSIRALKRDARSALQDTFDQGRTAVRREVTGSAEMRDPNVDPEAAIEFLRTKADFFVTGLTRDAEEAVRVSLLFGLKNGLTTRETMQRVTEALIPWTGSPDDADVTPHRIETVVRTNSTEAFNQGRLVGMREPEVEEFVTGVQYSAIIDTRTTEVCQRLDGKYFRSDDPDLDRLTPPNHFNCRSVLVPVIVGDEDQPDEFISASEVGRATELAGKGFA